MKKVKNLRVKLGRLERKLDKIVFHRSYERKDEIRSTERNMFRFSNKSDNYDIDSRIDYIKRKNLSITYKI